MGEITREIAIITTRTSTIITPTTTMLVKVIIIIRRPVSASHVTRVTQDSTIKVRR